jgi:hypothetical protein
VELDGEICKIGGMSQSPTTTAADGGNEIATIRIELRDTDPLIWRKVEVPTSITLTILHDIIQAVMGWSDYHLWEFTIDKQRYGLPMEDDWGAKPRRDAAKVCLRDVLKPRKTTIDYLYDFGDGWEHRLTVTGVRPGDPTVAYPRYVGGEKNAPPEDCGGLPGFYDLLDAMTDTEHPNHADVIELAGAYDPDKLDELSIKQALLRIAKRRKAATTRLAKKTSKS